MEAKPKPNDRCPCGSGKKFKRCCDVNDRLHAAENRRRRIIRNSAIGLLILGIIALFSYNATMSNASSAPQGVPLRAPQSERGVPGTPQPSAAPPGKVWSTEHGHWHDKTGEANPLTGYTPAAQPSGPVPKGKVWSTEHGHWHDAAATVQPALPSVTPVPQPAGEVPEGKIWSTAHGHWHDIPTPLP